MPVDGVQKPVQQGKGPGPAPTPLSGSTSGVAATGYSGIMPALTRSIYGGNFNSQANVPRRRLRDLVAPLDTRKPLDPRATTLMIVAALGQAGNPSHAWLVPGMVDALTTPNTSYVRAGASTIYREQGNRLIAVKFSVRDRDLAGAVSEAQNKTAELIPPPYRTEWSGEF